MSRKKRHRQSGVYEEIELNIMPFIDIFSLLNTFLLFSAVFVSIGIIEVQVPFFSNATPESEPDNTRTRVLNVDVQREKIELTSSWSAAPIDERKETYDLNEEGLKTFHAELVRLKLESPESDKVTVFSDDDVVYEKLTNVLDAIKLRWPDDPQIPRVEKDSEGKAEVDPTKTNAFLFEKIVMGSVIL